MVLMCTGIPEETKQNELYLQAKEMKAELIRDKVSTAYNPKTTHLIVGAMAKTEKFLSGLAAGIPMVDVGYIKHSREAGCWIQEIQEFDIGSQHHHLRQENRLYVAQLAVRQAKKMSGGVFQGWRVVVLIEDLRQQEIYRRLMELGGAKVDRWTVKHLADLPARELGQISHIISHPNMLGVEVFRKFLVANDATKKVPVVAYIYVGDFLTRQTAPPIHLYDIRQQAMLDLLTTEEVRLKLQQLRVKPPDHLLLSARPVLSVRSLPTLTDPGPSLQESPDLLDDQDDLPDHCEVNHHSPGMERNHSQVISCDIPEDFEYEEKSKGVGVVGGSVRKRSNNKSVNQLEGTPKKIKLNLPEDSSEEIEILDETPSKTKGLFQLKRKAQAFMRASSSSANTSQSKLDDWVVRSPRRVVSLDVSADDSDVIFVDDQKKENSINRRPGSSQVSSDIREPEESRLDNQAGPDQPSRRQRKTSPSPRKMTKSKSVGGGGSSLSNHFLAKTRSGSTRKTSVRSQVTSDSLHLGLVSQLSQCSTASQDSFCSEAGSDVATPVKSLSELVSDEPGQKTFFCHNLLVQRRTLVSRLDVGHCALPRVSPRPTMTPSPLPASMCNNIWTCLDTEQELRELNKEVDESWLAALDLLTKVVNINRFAPVAALHKVLIEALRDHKDSLVRTSAHQALLHCVDMLPPGPDRPEAASYYLELMSKTRPHLDKWEFDCGEPWEFLRSVIESCVTSQDQSGPSRDSPLDMEESSGPSLLLSLLTEICESDMTSWYDHLVTTDNLDPDYKPILAQVLFPTESVGWSRRVERLCKLYMEGLTSSMPETDLSCIRKLVGLAAQLIQFKERSSKNSHSNSKKLEMAHYMAFQLSQFPLSQERLWAELYLLQPTWLAALVSRQFLAKMCNKSSKDEAPALRSLIANFIDTEIEFHDPTVPGTDEEDYPLNPSQTSTPLAVRQPARKGLRVQNMNESQSQSPIKPAVKKIKVNVRNKYGETPLHQAAKKGNIARLSECLNTPGVDINSQDFSGFTPLHEAVGADKVEAVQLLLDHVPHSHTLDKYFVVSQSNLKSPRKKVDRVDVLAVEKEEGMNPVHEAVDNNNLIVTKLFLDTIAKEQARPNSGLPSVDTIMATTTKAGETVVTLAKTDEMRELLKSFSDNYSRTCEKENCPTGPLFIPKKDLFGLLTELSVTKYIATNCLPHIYGMFKEVKVSEVIRANERNISLKLNEKQAKWGPMDLKDGLIVEQFSRRPRFDVFRSEAVKCQDVRDFENLIYFKKQYRKIDPQHPAMPMLTLLKISK
eukprot:GFUD01020702.1.p1 GENE.GFUD01020702.1~~GFUD01020702.1.p1  ORF type:complete len:1318 (+),score=442.38 GFUD01020702.1:70-3954(+)